MNARTRYVAPLLLGLCLTSFCEIYRDHERLLRDKEDRAEGLQQELATVQKSTEDSRLALDKSMGDLQRARDELALLQQSVNARPYQFSAAQTKVWTAQMKVDAAQLAQLKCRQDTSEALTALNSLPFHP